MMKNHTVDSKGLEFIGSHEGEVLVGYRDPVGIPTIGWGFTNRSKIVTQMVGKIVPGVTRITHEQAKDIFQIILSEEYEPYVYAAVPVAHTQEQHNAMLSAVYNLGPKFMTWKWLNKWLGGSVVNAANHWANNYNTAGGKKLPGLVRRRKEEAHLFLTGEYPVHMSGEGVKRIVTAKKQKEADPVIVEAQEILTSRGFNPGAIDGWMGDKTGAAIKAYQEQHPHLINNGVLGKATLSQLRRDANLAKDTLVDVFKKVAPVTGAGGGAAWFSDLPTSWIVFTVGILAVVGVAYLSWKYRDLIERRFNAMFNEVEA